MGLSTSTIIVSATANDDTATVAEDTQLTINVLDNDMRTLEATFDSHWRPFDKQTGAVLVSIDNGAPTRLLEYTTDNTNDVSQLNESLSLEFVAPVTSETATLSFQISDADNDWYWAIDNLSVLSATGEPFLDEDFDSLAGSLLPAVDELVPPGTLGWTQTPPTGWTIETPVTVPQGTTEWRGWTFTTLEFWTAADQQAREEFTKSAGVFAVADPDEWEDFNGGSTLGDDFESTLTSPDIPIPADIEIISVTQGANGTVAIEPDGTLTYTPDPDFNGTDTFGYTISEGDLDFTSAAIVKVEVTPVDDAPSTLTVSGGNVAENAPGAAIGALSVNAAAAGVVFAVTDPKFIVTGDQLALAPGEILDFETDGADVPIEVEASNSVGSITETVTVTVLDTPEIITLADGGATYQESGLPEISVTGGDGDDRILGDIGDDVFFGAFGADTIRGGRGDDEISGNAGDDRRVINDRSFVGLSGDAGDDVVSGGDGVDVVRGGAGNDIVNGDAGNDALLSGDAGDDEVYGGTGDDVVLRGGSGDDLLDGGEGDDRLVGDRDDDTLLGGAGRDTLLGGAGDDVLNGGIGNDVLIGGFLLKSGLGFDTAGTDTFLFEEGTGADVVRDFTDGEDRIDFTDFEFASADAVLQLASQSGDDVVLALGGGDSVTLRDVALASLGDDDFIL